MVETSVPCALLYKIEWKEQYCMPVYLKHIFRALTEEVRTHEAIF